MLRVQITESKGCAKAALYVSRFQTSKYPNENNSTMVFLLLSCGRICFGTSRRQLGRGGESVVGMRRPTRAANSFDSKAVGSGAVSEGPSMIAARSSRSFWLCSTSKSERRRKRPGTSPSSQTRIIWSPRIHKIFSQYGCGMVILASALIGTNSGANRTSTICYQGVCQIITLFSIELLTSTICYHIICNRMWYERIAPHQLWGTRRRGHFCETIL